MSEAHCNKLPHRKALGLVTHDNTGGPFVVECQGCGEVYPSFHCLAGGQIADTGDYEDARCPHCDQIDPEECDNAALAWNTQQLKINELQQRLNAADQRIDELEQDKARLDALESNCWDVRFNSSPNGDAGDSSINIEVVGHWMDKPYERVIGENYSEDLRAAIDQAMKAPAYPPARPEYSEIDIVGRIP